MNDRAKRSPQLPDSPSTPGANRHQANHVNQTLSNLSSDVAALRSMVAHQQSKQVEAIAKGVAYGMSVVMVVVLFLQAIIGRMV